MAAHVQLASATVSSRFGATSLEPLAAMTSLCSIKGEHVSSIWRPATAARASAGTCSIAGILTMFATTLQRSGPSTVSSVRAQRQRFRQLSTL